MLGLVLELELELELGLGLENKTFVELANNIEDWGQGNNIEDWGQGNNTSVELVNNIGDLELANNIVALAHVGIVPVSELSQLVVLPISHLVQTANEI